MKSAPIPLVLDLWSLGHGGADIAARLGFPDFRHVTRIVAQARQIRDKRTVLHCYPCGRVTGNLRKAARILIDWPELQTVPLILRKHKKRLPRVRYPALVHRPRRVYVRKAPSSTHCKRGHALEADNVAWFGSDRDYTMPRRRCKACITMRAIERAKVRVR